MTNLELFAALGGISAENLSGAEKLQSRPNVRTNRKTHTKRAALAAAIIAMALLLVGCAVAYASGWFRQIFSSQGETPLSAQQIQYIQSNERFVGQSQTRGGWTIDLKSTICDGETGYLVFGITAPEDVNLEQYLTPSAENDRRLSMGNYSASRNAAYSYAVASVGTVNAEQNYWYLDNGQWLPDQDGKRNTVLFCMTLRCERMDPSKPMLLEHPFGKEVSFRIRLLGITLEYSNQELRRKLDDQYAGQDYIVDGEEAAGLFCSDILTDEEWYFDVTFDPDNQFVELIQQSVPVQARVWRYADETKWETRASLEEVQISSFRVTPFGATVSYVSKPDVIGISPRLEENAKNTICAVMKDGGSIRLNSDGNEAGILRAETPIVLSQLDYILLEDGTKLFAPNV